MHRILLAEDNEMNRDMLSRRLARYGYDVVVAENGQEAIALTASEKPDVVLMDLTMPVLDGWEATRRLRADESTAEVPIIALTAHALKEDRQRALEAGCTHFLTKPVDIKQLQATLRKVLADP